MSTWRNDFNDPPMQVVDDQPVLDDGEPNPTFGQLVFRPSVRVLPHLGWQGVPPGKTVTVPDDQDEHMEAGGWARVQPPAAPAPAAPTPTAPAAVEGSEPA